MRRGPRFWQYSRVFGERNLKHRDCIHWNRGSRPPVSMKQPRVASFSPSKYVKPPKSLPEFTKPRQIQNERFPLKTNSIRGLYLCPRIFVMLDLLFIIPHTLYILSHPHPVPRIYLLTLPCHVGIHNHNFSISRYVFCKFSLNPLTYTHVHSHTIFL